MTREQANKIKRILKKEGINHQTYLNGANHTFKIILIDNRIGNDCSEEYKKEIINVLRALSINGLRPEYEKSIVRRTNAIWTYDQYSIIFR